MRLFLIFIVSLFYQTVFAEGKDQIDLGQALIIAQSDLKQSENQINRSFALDAISDADLPQIGFKRDVRQLIVLVDDEGFKK